MTDVKEVVEALKKLEKATADVGRWPNEPKLNRLFAWARQIASLLTEQAEEVENLKTALANTDRVGTRVLAELNAKKARVSELDQECARWIARMADVREASGIGAKPMLDEIPAALAALKERADRVSELERRLGEVEGAREAILSNVRSEIRDEVAYAIELACACSDVWRQTCPAADCPHRAASHSHAQLKGEG